MSFCQAKTIFMVLHQGFTSRYLLRTDILRQLKKKGHRIVILVQEPEQEYLQKEFKDTNIFIERFETEKCRSYEKSSYLQRVLKNVRVHSLIPNGDLSTLDDIYKLFKIRLKKTGVTRKLYLLFINQLIKLCRRYRWFRKLIWAVENNFFAGKFHSLLFEKYRPDMLITASLGYFDYDQHIMREAKKWGVKVVPIVLQWDNTSSKGLGTNIYHSVIAWTENIEKGIADIPRGRARKNSCLWDSPF